MAAIMTHVCLESGLGAKMLELIPQRQDISAYVAKLSRTLVLIAMQVGAARGCWCKAAKYNQVVFTLKTSWHSNPAAKLYSQLGCPTGPGACTARTCLRSQTDTAQWDSYGNRNWQSESPFCLSLPPSW